MAHADQSGRPPGLLQHLVLESEELQLDGTLGAVGRATAAPVYTGTWRGISIAAQCYAPNAQDAGDVEAASQPACSGTRVVRHTRAKQL